MPPRTAEAIDSGLVERLRAEPAAAVTAAELFLLAGQSNDSGEFLGLALPVLASKLKADYLALAATQQGVWQVRGETGKRQPLPSGLLGDVLDQETPLSAG